MLADKARAEGDLVERRKDVHARRVQGRVGRFIGRSPVFLAARRGRSSGDESVWDIETVSNALAEHGLAHDARYRSGAASSARDRVERLNYRRELTGVECTDRERVLHPSPKVHRV